MASTAIPHGHEAATYKNHGFDPETVKFLLIEYDPSDMIKDLCNWGMKIMTINEYDYDTPGTIQTAIWVMCENSGLVMFNLKYKNKIIMETTQEKMNQFMHRAHSKEYNQLRSEEVDYMNVLIRMAPVKRAIDNFLSTELTPWYKYYV